MADFKTFNVWEDTRDWENKNTGTQFPQTKGKDLPFPAEYQDVETGAIFYFENHNTYRFSGYGVDPDKEQ